MMHQRISRKIIIYLFLFIILGSVNNFKYINSKLFKINLIDISVINNSDSVNLYERIKDYKKKNIFFLDSYEISEKIKSNNLVEKFWVFKKYPSTLKINLLKTNFLGITKINNIDYLVGSNGKFIRKKEEYLINRPFIFGSFEANEFLKLKEILDKSNFDISEMDSFYYFKSNRWDIKTGENLTIRLPSDLNKNLLDKVYQVINDKNFLNIKTIDLRQNNQIVIYE